MIINNTYNPNTNIFFRIWDHASFGLQKNTANREDTPLNIAEKAGDSILQAIDLIPIAAKAAVRAFQDPRIVTIALTSLALFTTSLVFYPVITLSVANSAYAFTAQIISHIPFWAVKFSAYITICATIIGYGLRAEGRFSNPELMRKFYNLPNYPSNPSHLFAHEIASQQLRS